MRAAAIFILSVALITGHLAAGVKTASGTLERTAVERVIRDSISWALDGKNTDKLFGAVAHDPDFFIFHPDSRSTIVGFEAFQKLSAAWLDPAFKAVSTEIRELRINFSRSGDVAWYSATLDDCGEWKGKLGCWKDTRWTGVLEQREGGWVIVQMHFSFASDKRPDGTDRSQAPSS
jgi:hypothetical protein